MRIYKTLWCLEWFHKSFFPTWLSTCWSHVYDLMCKELCSELKQLFSQLKKSSSIWIIFKKKTTLVYWKMVHGKEMFWLKGIFISLRTQSSCSQDNRILSEGKIFRNWLLFLALFYSYQRCIYISLCNFTIYIGLCVLDILCCLILLFVMLEQQSIGTNWITATDYRKWVYVYITWNCALFLYSILIRHR